jgi:CspA family cold shock protein
MKMRSDGSQTIVCQRCGRGYVLTPTYLDLLERWGARVVVPVVCPTCFLGAKTLPKEQGKVKWFNPRKRYGFIATQAGDEVFFHQDQLLDDSGQAPRDGQAVRFHLHFARKGPEALNVELVKA